jgi:hypothetical protein
VRTHGTAVDFLLERETVIGGTYNLEIDGVHFSSETKAKAGIWSTVYNVSVMLCDTSRFDTTNYHIRSYKEYPIMFDGEY